MSAPAALTDAELRRAPRSSALARLCAALCPGGRVGAVRRLRGGISCGMHAVDLVGPRGERQSVVLRRYGADHIRDDPAVAEREWLTLGALARVGAPTPCPIWLDRAGVIFGGPAIVTSRLPGRGLLAPRDPAGWIRQLAVALARIHAAPFEGPELASLLDQHADLVRLLERAAPPPGLASQPGGVEVWSAMRRHWPDLESPAPSLVHGDYWPGNTLWRYGRLTGVVDWEQAGRGDPAQDVGCCRLDLALLIGPAASETFLRDYEIASGRAIADLFFWDLYIVTQAIGPVEEWAAGYHDLGRTDVTPRDARARLTRFTADALARAEAASRQQGATFKVDD